MERIPLNWAQRIPPVTRIWALSSIVTSIIIDTKVINVEKIIFLPDFYKKREFWRLLTPFLYFGPFNLNLILTFSNVSEQFIQIESSFTNIADYLWFLLLNFIMLISYAITVENPLIFGPTLIKSLTYYHCMKNPEQIIALWGIVSFKAAYYAPVSILLELLIGEKFSFTADGLWLIIGHLLYYSEEVLGKLHGVNPLQPIWKWRRVPRN